MELAKKKEGCSTLQGWRRTPNQLQQFVLAGHIMMIKGRRHCNHGSTSHHLIANLAITIGIPNKGFRGPCSQFAIELLFAPNKNIDRGPFVYILEEQSTYN